VINFYAGGSAGSKFGGSTYRTVKELMVGADRVDNVDCSEYFDTAMMTVSSLTEYGISRNKLREYLDDPIKSRPAFDKFDGMIFIDSGGFQILQKGGLDGSDFQIEMDQDAVFNLQRQMGGDVLVNLDRPISPGDTDDDRIKKARQTAKDAERFVELADDYPGALFLTVHGYYYSMLETFVSTMQEEFGDQVISEMFDGVALGGLVPKKDDRDTLIEAVQGCKEIMREEQIDDLPLHVLGISSGAIPLLIALGVDTFDSSSYLRSAINAKYATSLMSTTNVQDVDFSECDCPVCSSDELVSRMQGDAQYRKDRMGPVAVHNLIVYKEEIADLRNRIESGTDAVIEYIDETVGRDPKTQKYAHDVVNEALGGYF
jgi:tRNA-guanine family transglycosylase